MTFFGREAMRGFETCELQALRLGLPRGEMSCEHYCTDGQILGEMFWNCGTS
jgi:hypothetical protein